MSEAQQIPGSEILGATIRADREYRVKVYDFKRPAKFSAEQIRTVQVIHETVARLASPLFGQILGEPVDVHVTGVDQLTYYELIMSFPKVVALTALSMPPLRGPMLLEIDGVVAGRFANAACGSTAAPKADQKLSEMQCLVIKDIVDRFVPFLDEAWKPVIAFTASAGPIETDPQFMQIVPPTEMIVLASFEVKTGDLAGHINLGIPYLTIEPLLSRLSAIWWFSQIRGIPGPTVASSAVNAPVPVRLFAGARPVTLSQLPSILEGEPLELPGLETGRLVIEAGGVPVAEVVSDVDQLGTDETVTLRVTEHHAPKSDGMHATAEHVSMPMLLSNAVESLTSHIKDIKHSVEKLRDDRDTLLSGVEISLDEPGGIDHRHHRDVAVVLTPEPPSIIAFVLSGLQPELAAAVLSDLAEELQPDVVRGICDMQDGDRRLHRKLVNHVSRRIFRDAETTTSGGDELVAGILNLVPRSLEKRVMEGFIETDKPLFERIARLMFVFEDFMLVDPTAIQKVFARVSVDEMALALKGVEKEVSAHILGALDSADADEVSSRTKSLGPARRRDVEAAQRDLIEELRQLEEAGEVVVARPEEVVE